MLPANHHLNKRPLQLDRHTLPRGGCIVEDAATEITEQIYQTLVVDLVVYRCSRACSDSELDDDGEASSPMFVCLAIARQSCPVV